MKVFKKSFIAFLSLLLLLSICSPIALATAPIRVTVGGEEVYFDVQPQIINDRTMVPLRAILNVLDATIEWDDATKTVTSTRKDTTIRLTIGNPIMQVNDTNITLDSPAYIIDGRTLVPARAISEAFNLPVEWNDATRTVKIKMKKSLPVEEIDWNGRWTKNTYDENGNITYIERSNGYWKKYTYDLNGLLTFEETSDGEWKKYAYNEKCEQIFCEDSNGYWTKTTYDEYGNVFLVENSDGSWQKSTYAANGNALSFEDSTGFWRKYTYGPNYLEIECSTGDWSKITYDEYGNKILFEYSYDSKQRIFAEHYDPHTALIVLETSSDGDWTKYTYGADEKEVFIESSSGYWEKRYYNEDKSEFYHETSISGITRIERYDKNGNLIMWNNFLYDSGKKYVYDENNNLISWESSFGEKEVFNSNGQLTYKRDGNNRSETYTYDDEGYLKEKSVSWDDNTVYSKTYYSIFEI